jgi:thiamine transport system permease protein
MVLAFSLAIGAPLISVFLSGIGGGGSLAPFLSILESGYYRDVIAFTFGQATLSVIVTLLVGLPGAYVFANYSFRGRDQILALTTVPFVLPSVLVVLGFVIFFGNSGIVNTALMDLFGLDSPPLRILYSWRAIVLAHSFYNIPLVFRLVSAVWSQVDERMREAAQNVGASRWDIFRDIEFPLIRQSVLSCALLTFMYSFTSFAIVLALGGARYTTIEVAIYNLAMFRGAYDLSSALAILQIAFLAAVVWLYMRIQVHRGAQGMRLKRSLSSLARWHKAGIAAYGCAVGTFLFGPLVSIIGESLQRTVHGETTYTLAWYKELFFADTTGFIGATPPEAILNSVTFAALAMCISVGVGLAMAYLLNGPLRGRGLMGIATMLPLGISTVTLALGYIVIGNRLDLDVSFWAIVLIHAIISVPFSVRTLSSSLAAIDTRLVEAAQGVGASRLRAFFSIEVPLLKGGLIAASVFSFAISLGELAAAFMLYGGRYTTIPIYIYRYIGGYRFGSAAAMGVVLMVVSAISFYIIDRMGARMQF